MKPAPDPTAPVAATGHTDPALALLWSSPFPAALQDAGFRLLDVNEAFAACCGRTRQALAGTDPLLLQPPEDVDSSLAEREQIREAAARRTAPPPLRRRILSTDGSVRWFTVAMTALPGPPLRWLSVMQDLSAEHRAREQALRSQSEVDQWFALAGIGMLVFDDSGLILRSNAAFEELVEQVPVLLDDAPAELQALLGWQAGALRPELSPGAAPLRTLVTMAAAGGRRLGARLSLLAGDAPPRRVMAVVEDRSAEEERDLAQLEIGVLMDTASVGVATYDPARGWLQSDRRVLPRPGPDRRRGGGLQGIGRELIEPESMPEYERLQQALRQGERAEVRYAVRHPELGRRWLLTRVEPGTLDSGRPTRSVVTLDVTEQERSQRRNAQLLRELTTILDGSTAGIAYLRGPVLVRCNLRFERMLGFAPGAAAGASLAEVFGRRAQQAHVVDEVAAALAAGRPYETELQVGEAHGRPLWYSLSVRRAEMAAEDVEGVAVLADITRLKTQQAELETLLRERELMFSLSDVGIAYQRGSRIERANQAMARLTGYAPPELTLLDGAELYESARDCVAFEAEVAQALRSHGRFSGERRLRQRDGHLLWVQVAVRPVDADDPDAGVICSFVDVDERRRARESLAVQAERTRAILNSVLVGIVTVSGDGIEWMNRSARRMFAGELADFVGEPISLVAPADEPDHPLRRSDWLERLSEGQAETFECRLKARDGREFWVVGNAVVTGRESLREGAGPQLTFALLDIERRRQAEINIAQAQASLQRVIATAPLAITLFDARSLQVLQLNQMAATFFALPLEAVLGRQPEDCGSAAKAAALREALSQARDAAPGADVIERELREGADERSGQPRVWDIRVVPLAPAGGEAAQLLLVASDVTGQRAAEQARLQAAIEQREALVREVHHRIKNNLQGVAGLLQQNAQRRPELASELADAVAQVQAIAQVYGLQVGSGGPLRLATVAESIAQSVQRSFGRPIAFEAGAGAADWLLPEAEAIPVALTLNVLLANAVRHAAGEAMVRCRLAPDADADGVAVEIRNPGRLPDGFDASQLRGGVSGLGLVRALLPRRSAALTLADDGAEVLTRVRLWPPSVHRREDRMPAGAPA